MMTCSTRLNRYSRCVGRLHELPLYTSYTFSLSFQMVDEVAGARFVHMYMHSHKDTWSYSNTQRACTSLPGVFITCCI